MLKRFDECIRTNKLHLVYLKTFKNKFNSQKSIERVIKVWRQLIIEIKWHPTYQYLSLALD